MNTSKYSHYYLFRVLLITFIFTLYSCKGDKGEVGPRGDTGAAGTQGQKGDTGANGAQGNAGAQGDKGDTGAQGSTGAQGATGNAQAVSYAITVSGSDWSSSSTGLKTEILLEAITSDIENTGMVVVYLRNTANNAWVSLSNSFAIGSGERRFFFTYTTGKVIIYLEESATSFPENPGSKVFRVVLLPGTAGRISAEIDLSDYEIVKKSFSVFEY